MSPATSGVERGLQVVAIGGYGRSGSTILDRVLGHHPDILAVGELVNLHHELWRSERYCGCGRRGRECPFWDAVRTHWLAGRDEASITRFIDLRARWIGRTGLRRARGSAEQAEVQEFVAEAAGLYAAIRANSSARIIVDSSKTPGWVDVLRRIPGIELKVVHLTRDGRGVIESLKRPLAKNVEAGVQHDIAARSALHTSLAWAAGNAATEVLMRRGRLPHVRIAYEALLSEPATTLGAIARLAGVDLAGEAAMIEDSRPFPRTHAVAGGRVRMSDEVVVDRRVRPAAITRADALTFWLIGGILALRYGYRPGGAATDDRP